MNVILYILLGFTLFVHGNATANKKVVRPVYFNDADTSKKEGNKNLVFPVPHVADKLFYVQRDPNTNTIVYDLNYTGVGQLDTDDPVHVYWIKYNERGQKEELNFIQRKFAYGLVTKPLVNGKFDVRFVSYKKFPLYLMKSATDNKYHMYATIAKKQAILNRIFLKIEGGTFWLPNISYVEVKGIDPATGKEIMERFKP